MTLIEAYEILEVDGIVSDSLLKENYRWLVRFYHPDCGIANDPVSFRQVVEAYNFVKKYREDYGIIIR